MNAVLRPVFTMADEPLIRFVIFAMYDDTETVPLFDDFEVNRKEAALILRKHRKDGSYIERRKPVPGSYEHDCFGHFYIEPAEET